jgi:transcriptional regulator GlxA family with amidase domain
MEPPSHSFKVGAVLFPGFELLDLYGPLEMLGLLGDQVSITLFAEIPGAIQSSVGVKGYAEASLKEASTLDLLLIPGGIGTRMLVLENRFIDLLREKALEARLVATVCTGSALLAKTGLLDGHRATSNKIAFDWVREQGPSVLWIREARWVEDGKFFTSSGISAGIDMTLGLISHLSGPETALEVARRAEYLWNEDRNNDPFS